MALFRHQEILLYLSVFYVIPSDKQDDDLTFFKTIKDKYLKTKTL